MAVTAEQSELQKAIVARIGEIQDAVKRALPSAKPLHDEFLVGKPLPKSPAEAVAMGRAIGPVAREYKAILLPRGIDVAKLNHLAKLTEDLGRLVAKAEPAAPAEPEPGPVAAKADASPAKGKGGGKKKKAK